MGSDVARTLSLALARVIEPTLTNSQSSITSIDVDGSGEFAVASVDDDSLRVLTLDQGTESHTILAKSAGVSLTRFTHHKNAVLFAATRLQPSKPNLHDHGYPIHYVSLYDDCYLRHFHGHTSSLRSLSMSPVDDSFMSAASAPDSSVRFWDLRSNLASSRVDVPASATHIQLHPAPLACYDPQGLIFALATHASAIRLFDVRSTSSGPFTTFNLDRTIHSTFNSSTTFTLLKFSPDGQTLLVGSSTGKLALIDAYDGTIKQTFDSCVHEGSNAHLDATYSADGQYILAGAVDGQVYVHRATEEVDNPLDMEAKGQSQPTGVLKEPVAVWNAHLKPIRAIAASHTRACVVTAAHEFGMWLPRLD